MRFEKDSTQFPKAIKLVADGANDGRLEVHEIFQLRLKPAYLVTLSACDTHLGGISRGDEMVGLPRALSHPTTNKLDALHAARQKLMKDEGKRHPYYWAAFVLIGDYR